MTPSDAARRRTHGGRPAYPVTDSAPTALIPRIPGGYDTQARRRPEQNEPPTQVIARVPGSVRGGPARAEGTGSTAPTRTGSAAPVVRTGPAAPTRTGPSKLATAGLLALTILGGSAGLLFADRNLHLEAQVNVYAAATPRADDPVADTTAGDETQVGGVVVPEASGPSGSASALASQPTQSQPAVAPSPSVAGPAETTKPSPTAGPQQTVKSAPVETGEPTGTATEEPENGASAPAENDKHVN